MYEFSCRIRFSEIDRSGRLSMGGLLRLFQDVGYAHAIDRGLGLEYTERTHCTWFLLSWQIHKIAMPLVGQKVYIRTSIYQMQATIARKSIAMYDEKDQLLAIGDTMWTYMDVEEQQPKVPKDGVWLPEDFGERMELPKMSRRILVPKDGLYLEPILITPYYVDTNEHANNVRLTELAMKLCGADGGCNCLRAEFRKQTKENSFVYPYLANVKEPKSAVVVLRNEAGEDHAVFYFE